MSSSALLLRKSWRTKPHRAAEHSPRHYVRQSRRAVDFGLAKTRPHALAMLMTIRTHHQPEYYGVHADNMGSSNLLDLTQS